MGTPQAEVGILLACLRSAQSEDRAAASLALDRVDWNRLLRLANRHAMVPLLSAWFDYLPSGSAPAWVSRQLHAAAALNAARNRASASHLVTILNALAGEGIIAIPLKGPVLAIQAYGDVALRQFADLDVLVKKCDFRRAHACLAASGFRPSFGVAPHEEWWWLNCDHEISFSGQGEKVELQWAPVHQLCLPRADWNFLWHDLRRLPLEDALVHCLSPENTLLLHCAHGASHCWDQMGWISDVARLISRYPDLDWKSILQRASGLGVLHIVRSSVNLAARLCGIEAPVPVRTRPSSGAPAADLDPSRYPSRLADLGFERVGDISRFWHFLRLRDRASDRLNSLMAFLVSMVLSPNYHDWRWVRLPRPLRFLYYLIRPVRLGLRSLLFVGRRAIGLRRA